MAETHDSQVPPVGNTHIKTIAIVGASGNVGSHIVKALLATKRFTITAISRAGSKNTFPEGVTRASIDYDDPNTIIEALRNHDVLIITMSVFAARDTQAKLIRAAADAGIPWVLPNEYGMYNTDEAQNDTIGPGKKKDKELVESLGFSNWVGLSCGFWYEHSLSAPGLYGFDISKREAVFFDDGTEQINTTTLPQVGHAVASLLSLPVTSSSNDTTTLSSFRNQMVYVSSFAVNQHDMFESLKRVTGTVDSDWTISRVSSQQRYDDAKVQMKAGDRVAFAKVLYTRYFLQGQKAGLYEISHGLQNGVLGLAEENLDEATKAAIDLCESGYWKNYGKH